MVSHGILRLVAALVLSLAAFAQTAPTTAPVPADPLELVTGPVQAADTPASRDAALQLLDRARSSYALRASGRGYDVRVAFTVDSHGQTEHDGTWEMHDLFAPGQGYRWSAKTGAAYAVTQLSLHDGLQGDALHEEGTANAIPLRLHEARAALFDPLPSPANLKTQSIRTSEAVFNGVSVTCILLSPSGAAPIGASGRSWEESEECIDPRSGLLQTHSQVPGRYYAYDYSNAPAFAGHVLPRKVAVSEGGAIVSRISVESLIEIPAADRSLFVPTNEMKARGRAVSMGPAQKILRVATAGPFTPGMTAHPVCVFGLVTASGKLVEAHSLQPSDPNSQAAVEAVKRMNFSTSSTPGTQPRQHFVFVIEKFIS